MPKPRLSIRTFLILCLLLGAVAIPVGYQYFKARRAAEIERLEKELANEWNRTFDIPDVSVETPEETAMYEESDRKIQRLSDRLEKLTGVQPVRPQAEMDIGYLGDDFSSSQR